MIRISMCLALVCAVAGCDPKAKANANDQVNTSSDRLSKAYESCATTSDCADELRCFDHVCRSTQASVVGDYQAALGERLLAANNVEGAIKAYTAAVNRYESDKLPMPLAVLCGKGRALTAAMSERELAEQAAATLHECLRKAPVGSSVRQQALVELAKLGGVGLDPELLARDESMRQYLTKEAAGPSSSKIQLSVTSAVKKQTKGHNAFVASLQDPGVRDRLLPCWEANYKATKQKALTTSITFKTRFQEGEFEEDDGYRMTIKSPAPAAGSGQACVLDIVKPLSEEFSKANRKSLGRWEGNIDITLQ